MEASQRTAEVTRTYDGVVSSGKLKGTAVRSVEQLPIQNEPTPSTLGGELPSPGHGLQFVPPGR
jgi:hypothetical protein